MAAVTDMREPTFLVLTVLTEGPRHGYALIHGVEAVSDGRVRLRAGTLYGLLERLANDGLVAPSGEQVVDGRLRRYYEITDSGVAELTAQTGRLQAISQQSAQRLRVRGVTA